MKTTILARKMTADNKPVIVHEDGDLTGTMGFYFRGAKVRKDISLSLVIANEACLFTSDEMGTLIRAANELAKSGSVQPGDLRAKASHMISHKK